MLAARNVNAGDMPGFPTSAQSRLYFALGWRVLAEDRIKLGSIQDQSGFVNLGTQGAQLRWRATNPGTRLVTQFTRNVNVETSATDGRHKIISFKAPAVGVDEATAEVYAALSPFGLPAGPVRGR